MSQGRPTCRVTERSGRAIGGGEQVLADGVAGEMLQLTIVLAERQAEIPVAAEAVPLPWRKPPRKSARAKEYRREVVPSLC